MFVNIYFYVNDKIFLRGDKMKYNKLYPRLRDCREDKDLRQKDIAQIIEDTQQHYQQYEAGKVEIPLHIMIELAKFYEVSLDFLAGLTNDKRKFW